MAFDDPETAAHKKKVVRDWIESIHGGEEDVWASYQKFFHQDAVWRLIGSTPRSGTFRGLDSIKRDFLEPGRRGDGRPGPSVQGLSSDFGITVNINEMLMLEDGRVLVLCTSRGAGRNGVPYNNEYCWIIRVRDDKIAEVYEFCDTVLIEEAHFDKKLVPRGTTTPVYER
jgi:hypothetical protein